MQELQVKYNAKTGQTEYVNVEVSQEELAERERDIIKYQNEKRVFELKSLLSSTDYIANKLAEAIADSLVTGDNSKVYELKTKYAKQLQDRKSWRDEIDRLEKN